MSASLQEGSGQLPRQLVPPGVAGHVALPQLRNQSLEHLVGAAPPSEHHHEVARREGGRALGFVLRDQSRSEGVEAPCRGWPTGAVLAQGQQRRSAVDRENRGQDRTPHVIWREAGHAGDREQLEGAVPQPDRASRGQLVVAAGGAAAFAVRDGRIQPR